MKKQTIGIIGGTGTLGIIFAKFFRKQGYKVLISSRRTKLTNIELVKESGIVIFSVPISATKQVINDVLPYTKKEQLLMDFTSIKEMPINEMLKSKASVIGLHPMFGKVKSIKNKTIVIIPARPGKWLKQITGLFKKEKINVIFCDAKKHDKIMSILQGLMHFSFIATAYTLNKLSNEENISLKELLEYGGIIYRLRFGVIARTLAQDSELYSDLAITNPNTINSSLKYEEAVKKLNQIIADKNKEEFKKFFDESASFFGDFKDKSLEETGYLIEQLTKLKKSRK